MEKLLYGVQLVEKYRMMMDFFIKDLSKKDENFVFSDQSITCFLFYRYLGGFSDKRMVQVAAGYSHCLGLTDVCLLN